MLRWCLPSPPDHVVEYLLLGGAEGLDRPGGGGGGGGATTEFPLPACIPRCSIS